MTMGALNYWTKGPHIIVNNGVYERRIHENLSFMRDLGLPLACIISSKVAIVI